MKIVVIGAGGFIGRQFVELAAAKGHAVVAGLRHPRAGLFPSGVTTVCIDATVQSDVEKALVGADCVVNCVMGPAQGMIMACRTIYEAAVTCRVRRAVHMSSIAVYGRVTGVVAEDVALAATDTYGAAKVACEKIAMEAKRRGLEVVILRPALVYGPESSLWVTRIARLLKAHRLGDLGELGKGYCNLVHVRDVTAAMLASLESDALRYDAYNLAPEQPPTWNAYLTYFAQRLGALPVSHIPRWRMTAERMVVAPILRVAEIVAKRLGFSEVIAPPITPGLSSLFSVPVLYDSYRSKELVPSGVAAWTAEVDVIASLLSQSENKEH